MKKERNQWNSENDAAINSPGDKDASWSEKTEDVKNKFLDDAQESVKSDKEDTDYGEKT